MAGINKCYDCKYCEAYCHIAKVLSAGNGLIGCGQFEPNGSEVKAEGPSKINHPKHYSFGTVECIDAIESALTPEEFEGFCKGNIIKYVWRSNHKGGAEDLQKAVWYADRLINRGIEDV